MWGYDGFWRTLIALVYIGLATVIIGVPTMLFFLGRWLFSLNWGAL